ncbi:H(+)-transporting V0 sector ATPase subunit a [Lobulomyces angularis]|nr:H(+)-transporting V0 sector ATPase subunit a [Lobulomyces angularis]
MTSNNASSLFRSCEMTHFKLYIPLEIAQQTVAEFGELGLVEFRDLNPDVNAFQRTFVNEIRRLDEMERKLRFLQLQMSKSEIQPKVPLQQLYYSRTRTQNEIDLMEERLNEHEQRLIQMNNSQASLNKRFLELTELRHVLRETTSFFESSIRHGSIDSLNSPNHTEGAHLLSSGAPPPIDDTHEAIERGESSSLNFVAGVISRQRMGIFERILFRALRGNLYMNYAEISEAIIDPITDEPTSKNVFCIFAHGKELLAKIKKICESLGATIYPVDERGDKRRLDALDVISRIEDLKQVLDNTKGAKRVELLKVADQSEIWENIILREKSIYYCLNFFQQSEGNKKSLIAEGWCPTESISAIKYALSGVTERTGSTVAPLFNEHPTHRTPPTYHRLNKFTQCFQDIVDAYGIATYQEVNPGLFTIITFPFLFAVMFGDFGHGVIMTLFAAWVCYSEKTLATKRWGEIWDMFFGGRYIILLMGLFSCYTGLLYNDVFSLAFNVYGSGWSFHGKDNSTGKYYGVYEKTYPFGIDPVWHKSDNYLLFSNSYKMKQAIILGMSFGISLNVFNYNHFNKKISIYLEFLPQIIFLLSIFGYLVFMILFKWLTVWDGYNPPGLLNTLIYMFLSPGTVDPSEQLYTGQATVQTILLLIAFCCIPIMLFAKPYYLWKEHQRIRGQGYDQAARSSMESAPGSHDVEELHSEEHFEFSDIMVHQVIHTIEFCLGAISNTASYLRLWALSLAHAQLSEVIWEMVMENAMEYGVIGIIIGFGVWFQLTCGILILIEGLSAFLHALRLHWVEFQNKFYGGEGRKFLPFSFAKIAEEHRSGEN